MDLLRHRSLFEAMEKGSIEWKTFNIVRGDLLQAYRVTQPRISTPRIIRFGTGRLLILKGAT